MRSISVFCLICIFHSATYSLKAVDNSGVFLKKADSLYLAGDYFAAALQYERTYFFSANAHDRAIANLQRAQCLKQMGNYQKARADLQRSIAYRADPALHFQILYELALLDYLVGNYLPALSLLKHMENLYSDSEQFSNSLLLYSLCLVMLEEWDLAYSITKQIIEVNTKDESIQNEQMLQARYLFYERKRPQRKSESRASNFATFIPGAGHLYAGFPGRGMVNASSQLASLGLTVLLAYHNMYISGFVIGLGMFQSFYFGGIKQASFLARQHNINTMDEFKSSIQHFLFDIEKNKTLRH